MPVSFFKLISIVTLCCLSVSCAQSSSNKGAGTSSGHYAAKNRAASNGHYKVGRPYKVKNVWYYPQEDYSYDETGIASWYGSYFHNKKTANGEVFNKNELTAAHKTLHLPCLARVTNLENGRSIVVRVNDRGPFSGKRIIDMSERAAQLLGFKKKGLAKVRVQVLADESKAIADAMRRYGRPVQLASIKKQQAPLLGRSVERETLSPVRSSKKTRLELMKTRPVPTVVQLPVTDRTRLFVQAGAFTVPENAYRLKEKLKYLAPTTISTIIINGTKFYRVRLGPVETITHVDALLTDVQDAGVPEARTVVD